MQSNITYYDAQNSTEKPGPFDKVLRRFNFATEILIHKNVKGYVYLFSGFGYDLIDYNHYTNGAGLGITLNDWI